MSWRVNPLSLWHCCQDFFHLSNIFTVESWANQTPNHWYQVTGTKSEGFGRSSSLQRHCPSLSLDGKEGTDCWDSKSCLGYRTATRSTCSRCWISQSCLWFEKSLSAFYRYLLITLNTLRPCLCIFEGNDTQQSKCKIEMGYQSAKRSSTGTRSCLYPLKEGCKVVLLVGVHKDKYFFS